MVEGARLESVYTGNRIVGSNPTFTATQSRSAVEACISAKLAGFRVISEPRPISSSNRSPGARGLPLGDQGRYGRFNARRVGSLTARRAPGDASQA